MRHALFVGVFVAVFALSATTALAGGNDSNNQRTDNAPLIPCQGLYTAGVGNPPGTGGAAQGTPGFAHIFENDTEMCHHGADPPGE
jgi:hypothetical protein